MTQKIFKNDVTPIQKIQSCKNMNLHKETYT